jgi:hypothetical protein
MSVRVILDRDLELSLRVDVRFKPESDRDCVATQYVAGPKPDSRTATGSLQARNGSHRAGFGLSKSLGFENTIERTEPD